MSCQVRECDKMPVARVHALLPVVIGKASLDLLESHGSVKVLLI